MGRVRVGVGRPRLVSKIRRTRAAAYGTPKVWYAMVAAVAKRDGNKCRDCGRTYGPWHTHHIIPVSRGGLTVMWNLKRICESCHEGKPFHGHMR